MEYAKNIKTMIQSASNKQSELLGCYQRFVYFC